jgi:hypothetical protein
MALLGFCLIATEGIGVSQTTKASLSKELNALMGRWQQVNISYVKTRDINPLKKFLPQYLTDDVKIWWTNTNTRSAFLEKQKAVLDAMKTLRKWEVKCQKVVSLEKNKSVVIDSYHLDWDAADPKTSKVNHWVNRGKEQTTWVKTVDGWRTNAIKSLGDHYWKDGKPSAPPAD